MFRARVRVVTHLLCFAATVAALVACGDNATSTPKPLVQVTGMVTNSDAIMLSSPSAFRIAAVWPGPNKTNSVTTDIVATGATFPTGFTLAISALPPASAKDTFNFKGVTFKGYAGEIGAFDDVNGNGKLDVTPAGDVAPPDRLLGVAARTRILYLEDSSELAAIQSVLPGARLGFSLMLLGACPGADCDQPTIVDLATPITIALSAKPKWE